jgi:hypothetical protein
MRPGNLENPEARRVMGGDWSRGPGPRYAARGTPPTAIIMLPLFLFQSSSPQTINSHAVIDASTGHEYSDHVNSRLLRNSGKHKR